MAAMSPRSSRGPTEQYVCQRLVSDCSLKPYCRSAENSSGEIGSLYAIGNPSN